MTCTAITPMMLRDRFHISDERAAELIRQLEAGGAIGPYNNGGPRQILIPHRTMYSYTTPQPTGQTGQNNGPVRPGPQPRRMSCLTIFLIVMFFMFMIKACGG